MLLISPGTTLSNDNNSLTHGEYSHALNKGKIAQGDLQIPNDIHCRGVWAPPYATILVHTPYNATILYSSSTFSTVRATVDHHSSLTFPPFERESARDVPSHQGGLVCQAIFAAVSTTTGISSGMIGPEVSLAISTRPSCLPPLQFLIIDRKVQALVLCTSYAGYYAGPWSMLTITTHG